MKAILARFSYEGNTFNPAVNPVGEAFQRNGVWRVGEPAVREWAASCESEFTGSLAYLAEMKWEAAPVFAASGRSSGGRLDAAGYQLLRATLRDAVAAALPADAIILHLHGAACVVELDDPEGDLLAMIRTELGFRGRIGVSLDLHANVTRLIFENADVITAYRTFPHIDLPETGRRIATLTLQPGVRTRAVAKLGMILPPTSARHEMGDLARMLALARQAEREVDDVALFPVQPWFDVAEFGSTVVVTGQQAGRVARRLAEDWYAHRQAYPTGLVSVEQIFQSLREKREHPWVLVDTADATTGGATGHSAFVLEQLLPHAATFNAPVLLQIVDPVTVDRAFAGETTFRIGDQQVAVKADRVRTAEGRYAPRGLSYRGMESSMNGAAVIEIGKLQIVAAREPTLGVTDPAFYECVGLQPDAALAVQVKSLIGWMAGYPASVQQGLYVDGPGATSLNFATLPFRPPNDRLFPMIDSAAPPLQIWERP